MDNIATQKRFTDIFIERPVLATVFSLIILLLGLRCFHSLPLRQFPLLDINKINIEIDYPGASPELVESYITTPVEESLMGIEGIDYIDSSSRQGESDITLNFNLGYNINRANADVTNAVSSVRYQLPKGILDPIISESDPNAKPIMYLAFSSSSMPEAAIGDYIQRSVKPLVANLPSVGRADILSNIYAMRLWLDPQKMAAKQITASDIGQAVSNNNVQGALGQLKGKDLQYNVEGNTSLTDANQFNQLPVKLIHNQLIRLQDVGHAELGAQNYNYSSYVNGQKTSMFSITPTSSGNPLDVSAAVTKLLPLIQMHAPAGMTVKSVWDTTKFIKASLNEVIHTLIIAILCVLIVIFGFLGSWRAILIPTVTIPLSLLGVSSIMLALGYSLNTLTFLAWVLGIGLVVDDAIVVLENISRHIEEGKTAFEAAIIGAREISFAVIAMTLTLAAVYAPIGLMTGMTGVLFREFAFTLASAVIISGTIALTLSPMMCSKLLIPVEKKSLSNKIDQAFKHVMNKYQSLLSKVLLHPKWVLLAALIIYGCAFLLYRSLPAELAPNEDQGLVITMFRAPTSANLDYTEKYSSELTNIYRTIPERENFGIINGWGGGGVNSGASFLTLKPWNERKKTADQIIQELMPKMGAIPGLLAFPFSLPPLPGASSNTPIEFVLKTTGSWQEVEKAADQLKDLASKNPGITNLQTNLQNDQLMLNLNIDRDKANILGVNMLDLSNSLNILLGEPIAGYYEQEGRSYQIIPQVYNEYRRNPQQLAQIPLRTLTGEIVPLGSFTDFNQTAKPKSLPHFQQLRAIELTGSTAPGYTLGQALSFLNQQADQFLPKDIQVDYSGQSRQFMQSQGAMGQVFMFSVIFIFLVLAAQFESFRNPLIVMLSVPLSLFGALLAMHLTNCTMNIFTEIGLVTLIGLISKHAILIVEFAEQIQATGKTVLDAVLESATLRLRPILMTTAAMVLGAAPLIMATGAGSEARRQLGWVIVAGMGIGTCFTLFIIPTVYSLIAKENKVNQ